MSSPYTGRTIATVPDGADSDADAAAAAAHAAAPGWDALGARGRASVVNNIANTLESRRADLALLDAIDGGAPIAEMSRDITAAVDFLRYFAGIALEAKGSTIPASSNLHYTLRRPFGVVVKIIPFNHPILFAASKIAAPLIAGNTVVLKPAEATPLSGLLMADMLSDVVPAGVLNVIVGDGPALPQRLVQHADVHRIGFTGSELTGRAILRAAADVGIKDVTLELGGKNALIAFPDADPYEVANAAVNGMNFTWSGQSCGSTSRALLHDDIADEVVEHIVKLLVGRRLGSPLDPATQQGTIVNERQYTRILEFIRSGSEDGATLRLGGPAPTAHDQGLFISPTVFDHVQPTHRIAQQEIFGPVLSVLRWRTEGEAIDIANRVRYGLTGSIFTDDIRRAHRVAHALEAGFIWINGSSQHFLGVPYGGVKASGLGREESIDELLSYTQIKAINVML